MPQIILIAGGGTVILGFPYVGYVAYEWLCSARTNRDAKIFYSMINPVEVSHEDGWVAQMLRTYGVERLPFA